METATRRFSRAGRDDIVLALLAVASSTTDVLSYLAFSGVFTSAMTGNTALLGMSAGEGRLAAASRSLAALIGFLLGVAAATSTGIGGAAWLGGAGQPGDRRGHLTAALGLELLFLGLFAAVWAVSGGSHVAGAAYVLIVLSAIAMGAQSVAARQVNLPTIPTVVFTSSLTSIVMGATEAALCRRPLPVDTIRQAAIFCAYLAGAVLAGVLALWHLASLVSVSLAAVALALALHVGRPRGDRPIGR